MWKYFDIEYDGTEYPCEAKVYSNPSSWGINESRVSKLLIYDRHTMEVLYCYERGWSGEEPPQGMIEKVLALFPSCNTTEEK